MSQKSTTKRGAGKVKPDKPPFLHQTQRWAKKVRGRTVYLGTLADDPTGDRAKRIWDEQKHAIRAGRKPVIDPASPPDPDGVTVKLLCDSFLEHKEARIATGELTQRSWSDYRATCLRIADTFGRHRLVSDLTPFDFARLRTKLAEGRGLVTLKGEIARARIVFNWGVKSELLENAARFGASFDPPSADRLRVARSEKPAKLFEQKDLRRILDACGVRLKAMVLLGINAGMGNSDCAAQVRPPRP